LKTGVGVEVFLPGVEMLDDRFIFQKTLIIICQD